MEDLSKFGIVSALRAIGGKWKPHVLFILLEKGTKRFGELRSLMPEITQGVLTQQLRELEKDGLVTRVVYQEIPPKVEYSLSTHGKSLEHILRDMCAWGFTHEEFIEKNKQSS